MCESRCVLPQLVCAVHNLIKYLDGCIADTRAIPQHLQRCARLQLRAQRRGRKQPNVRGGQLYRQRQVIQMLADGVYGRHVGWG